MEGEKMILWLNGPYGVGKSTLAEALHDALQDSFIFDAEQVGNAIRDNMPEPLYHETFEEYPLWHDACVCLLTEISRAYRGHILVPMTLKQGASTDIFSRLHQAGTEVSHVILTADEQEIRRRIVARGEEPDCWCARHAEGCIRAQQNMPCDLRLRADESPESLANAVIHAFEL